MSDPFDPIDDWLSADVELMSARPGTFDRVHRRARHRKAAVGAMTAAGAAVVIAVAVAVPQLASSLLPGHGGGGPAKIVPQSSSSQSHPPLPSPRRSVSSHPTPHRPSPASGGPSSSGGLSILNSSAAPDARFEPASITFVNDSVGAVLGQTTAGCPAGTCTTMAGTSDYGQSWTKVDAPPAGPPSGSTGVSQVRFLDGNNGWAFGPELYATHSGGATWTKIAGLKGRVIDLSTVDDQAYAVVATCTGSGSDFASGCSGFALYSTFYNSDDWQPVPGVAGKAPVRPGGLQLTGQYGYLLAGSALFAGSPSGGPWQKVTPASGLVPACLASKSGQSGQSGRSGQSGLSGLIAPGANSDLYLICQPTGGGAGTLYASADAGQTWQKSGPFTEPGPATSLAVAPTSGTLVAATTSGLFYSTDQRTWHRASTGAGSAPAGGFGFVGMTTTTQGVAISADASLREIFITSDGGLTWAARAIS
jgi:photosystem II stability/assembly factor-like uncharacterized protein